MDIKSHDLNSTLHAVGKPAQAPQGKTSKKLGVQHSDRNRAKIRELSKEFEGIFLNLMLSAMRKTVPKSELTDGGNGEEIFRSMLDQEYAKSMAHRDMTGLAQAIEASLLGKPSLSHKVNQIKGNSVYKAEALSKGIK